MFQCLVSFTGEHICIKLPGELRRYASAARTTDGRP